VTSTASDDVQTEVARRLRQAGARFAFLFGSQARGDARPDSDVDVAAWWSDAAPQAFDVLLPPGVDLLVLNHAPWNWPAGWRWKAPCSSTTIRSSVSGGWP